jgi:hypothetical protein
MHDKSLKYAYKCYIELRLLDFALTDLHRGQLQA